MVLARWSVRRWLLALVAVTGLGLAPAQATPVPNPADFAIIEGPGTYTVVNNSDDWFIYGFLVGNPIAASPYAIANVDTIALPTWVAGVDPGTPAFFYNNTTPDDLPTNLGPHSVSPYFFWGEVVFASPYVLNLVHTGGAITTVGGEAIVTPLPAALPLFAAGLGLIGVLARRRKRTG
ncbi:MAG: VPLPA-CTERM sorting domain-containing protein [Hyphomicrobiales bacterium]|nr:VPLPA-CTERM sorting domain-containing protein [Hyphomicrobiales bacterium]